MRGRDSVILLEPQTTPDGYTEEPVPDWTAEPTPHPVAASVDPLSSDEQTVTADTVISRWACYLPADCGIRTWWRVRWDGHDHEVDGEVAVWKSRIGSGYISVVLKRISGTEATSD